MMKEIADVRREMRDTTWQVAKIEQIAEEKALAGRYIGSNRSRHNSPRRRGSFRDSPKRDSPARKDSARGLYNNQGATASSANNLLTPSKPTQSQQNMLQVFEDKQPN